MVSHDRSTLINGDSNLPDCITQKIFVSIGILKLGNLLLLSYRDESKEQGGFWEFPGGKHQPEESSFNALCREFSEELDINILDAKKIDRVCYLYDEKIFVSMDIWLIKNFNGIPKNVENQEIKWVDINNFNCVQMTKPNKLIYDISSQYILSEKIA